MQTPETEPHRHDDGSGCLSSGNSWRLWGALLVGAVLVAVIGTWLVWFSFVIQRDIRAACQRLMSETVERCVDTVVIQRGGMRR